MFGGFSFSNPFGKKNNIPKNASTVQAQAVTLKPLTTFLGQLLKEEAGITDYSTIPYNGKQGTIPNDMALLGRYEAVLTQAAYMSRLIYDSNPVMMGAVQFIDELPPVVNSALTLLNKNSATLPITLKKVNPTIGKAVLINDPQHDTPCYIQEVDYRAQTTGCPHPGKKVVYITFRGTNSLKTTFTDLKAVSANIQQLLDVSVMGGKTGSDVFHDQIYMTPERNIPTLDPFGAHAGFVANLMNVMPQICKILETDFLADGTIDRIIVNGHSLGGANATLCALVLAGFKDAGLGGLAKPTLHCITYGAPKCLMSYTRTVFNNFLTGGIMTLDRVANRMKNSLQFASQAAAASTIAGAFFLTPGMDIIPTIPPMFEHPGFSILNTELMTQSKTGRSKNISDIREMFGGLKSATGWFKDILNIGFNELPTYAEFMSCFAPTFKTEEAYAKALNNRFGTIYSDTTDFKVEYGLILAKYEKITGSVPVQVSVGQADAEQKTAEAAAKLNTGAIEQGPVEPEAEDPTPTKGGALTAGLNAHTRAYKKETLEVGPNHVVYSCKQKISFGFCHTGYMGISFNGMMKTMLVKKPNYAQFVSTPTQITYSEVAKNVRTNNVPRQNMAPVSNENPGPVGGKRVNKTKKAHKRQQKKSKTMNRKRR
jgi:hypothetical protein